MSPARPATLITWVIGVLLAVGVDIGTQYAWAPRIAAFVKARHGWWFDDSPPSEGPRPATHVAVGSAFIGADGVRFHSTNSRVEATAPDGALQWSASVTGQPVVLPEADGAAYVVDNQRLRAFDSGGNLRWSIITNDEPESMGGFAPYQFRWDLAHLALDSNGGLCASGREAVWCFESDGRTRWRWATQERNSVYRVVAGPAGRLYASLYDSIVLLAEDGMEQSRVLGLRAAAFDKGSGLLLAIGKQRAAWLNADGTFVGEAAVSDGPFGIAVDRAHTIYVSDGSLRAFDKDGHQRWSFSPRDYLRSEIAIDVNGDALVAGRRRLFAVRPDGVVRWIATMAQPSFDPLRVVAARPEGVYVAANPRGPVVLRVER